MGPILDSVTRNLGHAQQRGHGTYDASLDLLHGKIYYFGRPHPLLGVLLSLHI